ncbi:Ig domain-containing protein, partial [bacterium]|nr:Ig domain-containing protein [bacterium]
MVARVGKILLFGLSCCMFATASLSQTPQVLQFGTTTSGTMNRDSDHWFQITTTLDGSLTITIRSDSTLTTMLYLYDHDMTTQMVFQSASSSPLKTIAGKNLSPGIYYLKIHYYGGEGKYAISPDFSEASYRNDNEPNNTTEQALRLKTSGSLTGHLGFYGGGFTDKDDWWQIDTILDGSIYVTAEVDSTLGMTLTLFDENLVERPVMDPSLEPAQQTIHRDNLAMGTYYVRAHCDSGYGSYTISSQVIPAAYLNDSEPNDDTINAQEIVPEKTFTGHLGYSDCGISDIIDYYRFTITSRYNDLIIRSETLGKLEFNLYLFDNKGNRLKYTTEKGASKVLHYYEADPGTYYIQMLQDTGYGSYAFVVTASTATQPEVIVNNPPVILSTTLPDASIDQPYEYRIIAQDPDKDNVVSYEILEGPAWLGINNSGVLGGTPDSDDAGSYIPVLIRVYDQNNLGCLFNTM